MAASGNGERCTSVFYPPRRSSIIGTDAQDQNGGVILERSRGRAEHGLLDRARRGGGRETVRGTHGGLDALDPEGSPLAPATLQDTVALEDDPLARSQEVLPPLEAPPSLPLTERSVLPAEELLEGPLGRGHQGRRVAAAHPARRHSQPR